MTSLLALPRGECGSDIRSVVLASRPLVSWVHVSVQARAKACSGISAFSSARLLQVSKPLSFHARTLAPHRALRQSTQTETCQIQSPASSQYAFVHPSQVDEVFINAIRDAGLYDKIWQAFAVFLPIRSVGVQGDKRTHTHVVALRAITSQDGMTADWWVHLCVPPKSCFRTWRRS